jgi:hypothetical protein
MARKRRDSKAQAIRHYCAENPGDDPADCIGVLADKGIHVTPALVARVRATMPRGAGVTLADLLAAKAFAARVGGIDAARQLVNVLARLIADELAPGNATE